MRIALVDFSHLLSVNFHARANDGGPNHASEATMRDLASLKGQFDRIVVCYDRKPYFRREIYPAYKAQREAAVPELVRLWKTCADSVSSEYQIAKADGFEADDCCATLALAYSEMNHTVEIVGADKDALQCVRDQAFSKRDPDKSTGAVSVRVLGGGGVSDEIRGTQYVRDRFGVEPHQFALAQAIMGDKGDNIPGIARLGPKAAAKLISLYEGEWDPLKCIYRMRAELAAQATSGKELPAFWRDFAAGHMASETAPGLELMLKLTTLRTDVPLDAAALLERKAHVSDAAEPETVEVDGEVWDRIADQEAAEMAAISANDDNGAALAKALTPVDELIPPHRLKSEPPPPKAQVAASAPRSEPSDPATPATTASVVPPTQGPPKSESLALRPKEWAMQLQPHSASEAIKACEYLWKSGRHREHESPAGMVSVAMLGRELGMGLMTSLLSFHVVQDRPFPKWNTLKTLAERDPNCEWFRVVEMSNDRCVVMAKDRRMPEPMRHEFTRELAEQAGYFTGRNKDNYIRKTRNMLRARCISEACAMWFGGSTLGMGDADTAEDD
jgi:5'-3' exonuclease